MTLDDGRELGYDRLLLATGAEPRRLTVPGAELDGVHYLRTLADCDAAARRGCDARRAGGGRRRRLDRQRVRRLGAPARARGQRSSIRCALPSERIFGPEIGAFYRDVHAQHGVELLLGDGRRGVRGRRRGRAACGPPAADASSATSSSSASAWCRASGWPATPGLRGRQRHRRRRAACRPRRPGVFAAGDVANAWHPFYERADPGRALGQRAQPGTRRGARRCSASAVGYDRIPYFFSDQYDVGMEYSGYAPEWDEVVFRGDRGERRVHRLLAARRARRGRHERQRLGRQRAHPGADPLARSRSTTAALADPDTPLESLAGEPATEADGRTPWHRTPTCSDCTTPASRSGSTRSPASCCESGEFAELIGDYGVTGATSNPTIFAKAITGSDRYDDQLRQLAAERGTRPAGAVLRARARRRPRGRPAAAPGLRRRAAAATGSSRSSARPTSPTTPRRTIAQATDLWQRLGQPNVMIKVPGTDARACPRSRSSRAAASTSTSRCCSRSSATSR